MFASCPIVERLGVVIHKASTMIEASIMFFLRNDRQKPVRGGQHPVCKENFNEIQHLKVQQP